MLRLKSLLYFIFFQQVLLVSNPTNPNVTHGFAKCYEEGSRLVIESGNQTIINWESFSIGSNEITQFLQSSTSSSVLNRVTSNQMSVLNGILQANGKIYLVNPHGIVVGKNAFIDTASFIGSTLNVSNEAFLANQELLFSGESKGALINLGTIRCLEGEVFLFAHEIENHGSIEVGGGEVGLIVGKEILFFPPGKDRICVKVPIDCAESLEKIKNELDPSASIYTRAINHTGIIDANSIVSEGGKVLLKAAKAKVEVSGEIYANGGNVHLLGEDVVIKEPAIIDVSSIGNGGKVLIGGDYQGKNPEIYNASYTTVYPGSSINADSKQKGVGGRVILWSDQCTRFGGKIYARGGKEKGDGGFVEVSGKFLDFIGEVDASAQSKEGKSGRLLLDPDTITISNTGGDPATQPAPPFSGWQFTTLPTTVDINVNTLSAALQNNPITLQANQTITLNFTGTLTGANTLQLDVGEQIIFQSGRISLTGNGTPGSNPGFRAILNHGSATPAPTSFPFFQMAPGTSIEISNPGSNSLIYVTYQATAPYNGGYIDIQGSLPQPAMLNAGTARLVLDGLGDGNHPGINLNHCKLASLNTNPGLPLSLGGIGGTASGGTMYNGLVIADTSIIGEYVNLAAIGSSSPPAGGTHFSGMEISGTSTSINGTESLLITGTAGAVLPPSATIAHGIHVVGGEITSTVGTVTLSGTGPTSGVAAQAGKGVYIESGASMIMGNSATGPLLIKGASSVTDPIAIDIASNIDFFSTTASSSSIDLTSSASGTIDINGNIKTSLGDIQVTDNVSGVNLGANLITVGGNIVVPDNLHITQPTSIEMDSGGGNITLDTIDASTLGNDLTLNAFLPSGTGTVTLNKIIGGGTALGNFKVSGNTINIHDDITTTLDISFLGPTVFHNPAKTITTGVGLGNITFDSTLNPIAVGDSITLNAGGGDLTFKGNVGASGARIGPITMMAGHTHLDASIFSNQSLTFGNPVEIGASVTLDSGPGLTDITFNDTVDGQLGGEPLTLSSGSGKIIFNGVVGGSVGIGAFSATATGGIEINANFATQNANMTFNNPTTFSNNPILSSGAGAGNILFNSTVNAQGALSDLTINAGTGDLSFLANVGINPPGGTFGALSMTAEPTHINGFGIEVRAQNLAFLGPLDIGSNGAKITATSGNINFTGTVDGLVGGEVLEATATGNLTFDQAVGLTQKLGNMTLSASQVNINNTILTSGIFSTTGTNQIKFDAATVETDGQTMTLTGPVEIKDQVILSTKVPSAGNIYFTGAVNQDGSIPGDLTLNAGGEVFFNESVGNLISLNTLSARGSQIHVNKNVKTTNAMLFQGPVQITNALNPLTFNSTAAGMHFQQSISGNQVLTLSATGTNGTILVDGNIDLTQAGAAGKSLTATATNHITFQENVVTSGGSGGSFNGGNVILTSTNGSVSVKNVTTSASSAGGNAGNISLQPTAAFQLGTLGPPNTKIPNGKIVLSGILRADKGLGGTGGIITLGPPFPSRQEGMSIATITSSTSGNDVAIFGQSLTLRPYEAVTVLGNLTITMDTQMLIEDLVSLNNISLNAPSTITRLKSPIMLLSSQGTLYETDNTHILAGQTLSVSPTTQSTTGAGAPADFQSLNFDPTVFQTDLKFGTTILGWDGFFPSPISPPQFPSQFPSQMEIILNDSLSDLLTSELFFQIQNDTKIQNLKKTRNAWNFLEMDK